MAVRLSSISTPSLNFGNNLIPAETVQTSTPKLNLGLIASPYEGYQLHEPTGYYYKGGSLYAPVKVQTSAPNAYGKGGGTSITNTITNKGDDLEGDLIDIGNGMQVKKYVGDAEGINKGELSMVAALVDLANRYKPVETPNIISFLDAPKVVVNDSNQPIYGAGRYLDGGMPLNFGLPDDQTRSN
jgi:hypothetical protein